MSAEDPLQETLGLGQEPLSEPTRPSPKTLKRKRSSSQIFEQAAPSTKKSALSPSLIDSTSLTESQATTHDIQDPFSPPTTPSSVNPVQPLTVDNLYKLRRLNGDMAEPSTPRKSATSKTTSKLSGKAGVVREILELNGLFVDDSAARETGAKVLESSELLVQSPRHSVLTKEQLDKMDEVRRDYAKRNEATFTQKFFGVFRSISREVQRDPGDQGELHVPVDWEAREWDQDGLDENNSRVFRTGAVPKVIPANENQKVILEDLPKVSNPCPDIIYGYQIKKHFTPEERIVNARYSDVTEISEGIAHPFFAVESKTSGDFAKAVNQACRGGAAMVQAHRKFKALLENTKPKTNDKAADQVLNKAAGDKPMGDETTTAYTLVLMPHLAEIYVHWAEASKNQITYQMHCVGAYAITFKKNLKECRAAVNNILDWGLGARSKDVKDTLKKLHERYKANKGVNSKGGEPEKTGDDQAPPNKRARTDGIDDDM
ncbi:MAG: hypothetical protein Q9225_006026 [Loekoesia sp. 1 TL-2023]